MIIFLQQLSAPFATQNKIANTSANRKISKQEPQLTIKVEVEKF